MFEASKGNDDRMFNFGRTITLRGAFVLGQDQGQYVPVCVCLCGLGRDDARTSRHRGGARKHRGDGRDLYGLSILTWRDNI